MPDSSPLAGPRELSDEDVEILHEIVLLACDQPGVETYPFRSLYKAHEIVLHRHGLDQKHDNVYIRFIAKLKDIPADLTLLQFYKEKLWDKFGIVLEERDTKHNAHGEGYLPSRRASLSSLPDFHNGQSLGADHRRPASRASASYIAEDTRPLSPGPQWPKANGTPRRPFNLSMLAQATPARRLFENEDALSDGTFDSERDLPRRKVFDHADWQPNGGRQVSYDPLDEGFLPTGYNADGFGPVNARLPALQSSTDLLPPPTPTQLIKTADEFQKYHLKHLISGFISHWYSLARANARMYNCAVNFDRRSLTKPVKDMMIQQYLLKLDERRGHHLSELRSSAERKWDRHLKSKAFSHWAQCAQDEVEKTAAATEHMIRFRCFQAWREYAASNERKIRNHVCRKFLLVWKNRELQHRSKLHGVSDYRQDTLSKRVFGQWIWSYRERDAARLGDYEVKRKAMAALVDRFRTTHDKEIRMVKRGTLHALQVWQSRKTQVDRLASLAIQHEASHAMSGSFDSWRVQHRYAPMERNLLYKLDERIVRSAFSKLVQVYRLREQAKALDRRRILRTAWDNWNDQLRTQSLSQRINERVVTECLYKWVLAERCILYQRLRTERLLERCTRKLLDCTLSQEQSLSKAFTKLQAFRENRLKQKSMRCWFDKSRTGHRHWGAAVATDERRLTGHALESLKAKHDHIQMLETQYAPNFILFYKGKQTLKTLQTAWKASRAKKRHEAYVAIRRLVKRNACKKFLGKWRDDTLSSQALKDVSLEIHDGKLITLATDLFSHWQERFSGLRQRQLQVESDETASLARRQLVVWREQQAIVRDSADKALEYDREHSRRAAYRCLRKLHFRIRFIQERQTRAYETELRQWSQRDLARNLLRLWLERSLRQRGVPEADLPPTAKTRRFKNMLKTLPSQPIVIEDGPTPPEVGSVQLESQGQDNARDQLTPAATAQYLSTPSRRFGRSLRTPVRPPLVQQEQPTQIQSILDVPQETPLAAAPATDSRLRQSRAFGRSAIGVRRTLFAPIPERSSFP